jgi:integrase
MGPGTIGDRIIDVSDIVGVKFRSHDLRVTFGNRHWEKGTDMATIAKRMGHESPDQIFKAYIGVSQEGQRNAQNTLGPQECLSPCRLSQHPRQYL